MTWFELLSLGVVIGANNLAVAITLGALGHAGRMVRIAAVFGVFEFSVPLLGLLLGRSLADDLGAVGNWLAPVLLGALGLLALASAGRRQGRPWLVDRAASLPGLVLLAGGLSVDNLLIGFTLGVRDAEPLALAAVIAAFAVVFTVLGLRAGAHGRERWQAPAEALSGLLLIVLAVAVAAGWIG